MKRLWCTLILAFASCGYLTYPLVAWRHKGGHRSTGAGHIGTLAGLLCVPMLPMDPWRCALVLLGIYAFSISISDWAEEWMPEKDDPRIVIDEWAGYLTSVAFLPQRAFVLIAGFILFRLFDIWKPLGIRHLGKLPGGWGVVLDDMAAGLVVNGILQLLTRIPPSCTSISF